MNMLQEGPLLNTDGSLSEAGRATSLIKLYDKNRVKNRLLRLKEWDYYLIHNKHFGIALTIADNAYMGLVSASFLNFEEKTEHTMSPMFWFPFGKTNLPESSRQGNTQKVCKGADFCFSVNNGTRHLQAHIDSFGEDHTPFDCDILLSEEPVDSMVIATPFPDKRTAFYYNQKIIGMRAHGKVSCFGRDYRFDRADSFGLLDWGRGVWVYESTWYWAAAMGMLNGHLVGFNLGYGFGDTSAASENMIFCDGKAHPFDKIHFDIPQKGSGDDFLSLWTIRSNDGRFSMNFLPLFDRAACTDLRILLSDQHQVFGLFTGFMLLDDGTRLDLNDFLGFAEKVHNKW